MRLHVQVFCPNRGERVDFADKCVDCPFFSHFDVVTHELVCDFDKEFEPEVEEETPETVAEHLMECSERTRKKSGKEADFQEGRANAYKHSAQMVRKLLGGKTEEDE